MTHLKRYQELMCDIWGAAHQKDYGKVKKLAHLVYDLLEDDRKGSEHK